MPSGRDCPICGVTVKRVTVPAHIWTRHIGRPREYPMPCPECGYGSDVHYVTIRTRIGVGVHRERAHGVDPVAEAVAVYEREQSEAAAAEATAAKPRRA